MFQLGQLMSLVRRDVERTIRRYHKPPRIGFVSSYDPKEHKVKVTFQPTGAESGWLPISALAVGNMFGHLSAPKIGDQVRVEYQEGEHDVGRIINRLFNKPNPPPKIQAGEYAKIHETGSGHYHMQDGTVQYAGPKFFKTGQDQQGQSGQTQTGSNNGTQQNQQQQQQQQNQKAGKQNFQYNPDGSTVFNVPDKNAQGQGEPEKPTYTATIKSDVTHTSTHGNWVRNANAGSIGDNAGTNIVHVAQNELSRSAGKKIVDKSQVIGHDGLTLVDPTMQVGNVQVATLGMVSDKRLKDSFAAFDIFDKAMQIKLWRFNIHAVKINQDDLSFVIDDKSKKSFGVIAQEVQELFPEIVSKQEIHDFLQVEEGKIAHIALRALQEYVAKTDAEIEKLKVRIAELEK